MSEWELLSKLKVMCKSQKASWVAFREALISFSGRADLTEWQMWDMIQAQSSRVVWCLIAWPRQVCYAKIRALIRKIGPLNIRCGHLDECPWGCWLCRPLGTLINCRGGVHSSLVRASTSPVLEDTRRPHFWKVTGVCSLRVAPTSFFYCQVKS